MNANRAQLALDVIGEPIDVQKEDKTKVNIHLKELVTRQSEDELIIVDFFDSCV
jgi:hypothetical protein